MKKPYRVLPIKGATQHFLVDRVWVGKIHTLAAAISETPEPVIKALGLAIWNMTQSLLVPMNKEKELRVNWPRRSKGRLRRAMRNLRAKAKRVKKGTSK